MIRALSILLLTSTLCYGQGQIPQESLGWLLAAGRGQATVSGAWVDTNAYAFAYMGGTNASGQYVDSGLSNNYGSGLGSDIGSLVKAIYTNIAGMVGTNFNFPSANTYIRCFTNFVVGSADYTMGVFIKPTAGDFTDGRIIMGASGWAGGTHYCTMLDRSAPNSMGSRIIEAGNDYFWATNYVSTNEWHLFTLTKSATISKLYIDGVLATNVTGRQEPTGLTNFVIGGAQAADGTLNSAFKGRLSFPFGCAYAMSSNAILEIYQQRRPQP